MSHLDLGPIDLTSLAEWAGGANALTDAARRELDAYAARWLQTAPRRDDGVPPLGVKALPTLPAWLVREADPALQAALVARGTTARNAPGAALPLTNAAVEQDWESALQLWHPVPVLEALRDIAAARRHVLSLPAGGTRRVGRPAKAADGAARSSLTGLAVEDEVRLRFVQGDRLTEDLVLRAVQIGALERPDENQPDIVREVCHEVYRTALLQPELPWAEILRYILGRIAKRELAALGPAEAVGGSMELEQREARQHRGGRRPGPHKND